MFNNMENTMQPQHLRIARPVTSVSKSCAMYCHGLGLKKVAEFIDHAGFNGCMAGMDGISWHLEFTQCQFHPIKPSPTPDDILVLYFPDKDSWHLICQRMDDAGFSRVKSFNPYWESKGVTFEDDDGYRVVIQNMHWESL